MQIWSSRNNQLQTVLSSNFFLLECDYIDNKFISKVYSGSCNNTYSSWKPMQNN